MVLYCTIDLWHIKIYISLVRKLKKGNIFLIWPLSLSIWSSNSGHEHKKGGHMNHIVLYCTLDLWRINIYIFLVRKLKKTIFLKFDHFSRSIWSSNSGHEHEKGGHMKPMAHYCTIDLWHIKIYIFLVQEAQKRQYFWILTTLYLLFN